MRRYRLAAVCLSVVSFCGPAAAQEFPNRLIRILLGGGPDVTARLVAEKMQASWKQPVIVEAKASAAGTLMSQEVANATPDGHTLMLCSSGQTMSIPYFKLRYDFARDFTAITQVTTMPFVLTVNPSVPVKTVPEFIAYARARPGALNYGSSSSGSPPHVVAEMLKTEAGIDMVHVPYKGVAAATSDLIGNQIQVMFLPSMSAMPLLESKSIRALAVTTEKRSTFLPNLPTMSEVGLRNVVADAWNGFCGPKGMSTDVVAKLRNEIDRIVALPDVTERLGTLGNEVLGTSPSEFTRYIEDEQDKWIKYGKAAGARAD
jgi:tripartite-type tricarboxylate transporter receptor subunit TctC